MSGHFRRSPAHLLLFRRGRNCQPVKGFRYFAVSLKPFQMQCRVRNPRARGSPVRADSRTGRARCAPVPGSWTLPRCSFGCRVASLSRASTAAVGAPHVGHEEDRRERRRRREAVRDFAQGRRTRRAPPARLAGKDAREDAIVIRPSAIGIGQPGGERRVHAREWRVFALMGANLGRHSLNASGRIPRYRRVR